MLYYGIIMEEPAKFPTCLRRAYAAALALYLAVAVPGYQRFQGYGLYIIRIRYLVPRMCFDLF